MNDDNTKKITKQQFLDLVQHNASLATGRGILCSAYARIVDDVEAHDFPDREFKRKWLAAKRTQLQAHKEWLDLSLYCQNRLKG